MARKNTDAVPAGNPPTEEQVVEYLRRTPDFLLRHPDVAVTLSPPSRWPDQDGVVDMQAFMIEHLKAEVERLKMAAEHIIHTTRVNMAIQNRTHQAVIALLAAPALADLAVVVGDALPGLLAVDAAVLCLETGGEGVLPAALRGLEPGSVDRLLGGRARTCALNDEMPGDPAVFGDASAQIRSSAMVRLAPGGDAPAGLLALGSRQGQTFHTGQGTDLLTFLAGVAENCIRRFLT